VNGAEHGAGAHAEMDPDALEEGPRRPGAYQRAAEHEAIVGGSIVPGHVRAHGRRGHAGLPADHALRCREDAGRHAEAEPYAKLVSGVEDALPPDAGARAARGDAPARHAAAERGRDRERRPDLQREPGPPRWLGPEGRGRIALQLDADAP